MHSCVLVCIILLSEVHDVSIIMHSSYIYYSLYQSTHALSVAQREDMMKLH